LRGTWSVFLAEDGAIVDFPLINDYPVFTDGGLSSTVLELARVLRGLFAGSLLTPESIVALSTPSVTSRGEVGYGLGLRLGELGGHRKVGHTGGYFGTLATAAYYPDDAIAIVVLMNTDGTGDAPTLEAQIARLVLGIPPSATEDVPLTSQEIANLSGTFEMLSEGQLKRYERRGVDGHIVDRRDLPGAEPYSLTHLGSGVFTRPEWGELRLLSSLDEPSDTIVETWGGFFGDIAYRVR
jgi:hypothetical protein